MSDENHSADFGTPFAALVQHFESNDIKFVSDPSAKSVQLFMTGDCAVYNCRFQITHDDDVLQARILLPVTARDPKMQPLVLEMLARANHGLALGSFDIEVDGGQISFHLGQVIPGGALEDKLVGGLFLTCMATSDRYFPALMRVMFGGNTPADAVYLSELDFHSEKLTDAKTSAPAQERPPTIIPMAKKRAPRPRKKNAEPKSGDQSGLFDPSKGEGTDRPPQGR